MIREELIGCSVSCRKNMGPTKRGGATAVIARSFTADLSPRFFLFGNSLRGYPPTAQGDIIRQIQILQKNPKGSGPKTSAAMTKSRFDDDVRGKPYLANFLKSSKKKLTLDDLYKKADLSRVDFSKQLDFEVKQKLIIDRDGQFEAA